MSQWTKSYTHRNVALVNVELDGPQDEHTVLLRTDAHHDNPHSRWDLELKHLEHIKEVNGSIIDGGDLFCAMQGKYDKRSDKSTLREEHRDGPYLDVLVDTAADFYEPYVPWWVVLGQGNHETAIYKKHETNLTANLVKELRHRSGADLQCGGYTGWVKYSIKCGSRTVAVQIWHAHGWGGGGPVTLGTIQAANRMPMMTDHADIVFSGHVHEAVHARKVRLYLENNRIVRRDMHILIGPTYKDEYGDGYDGWHVETGKSPKPLGAFYAKLGIRRDCSNGQDIVRPTIRIVEAGE